MTFAEILPSILAGKIATFEEPSGRTLVYVKDVTGDIKYSTDNVTYANFTNLYRYVDETSWSLLPITTISSVTLDYTVLVSNWDAIVQGSGNPGAAATSSVFRAFANAIGFTS